MSSNLLEKSPFLVDLGELVGRDPRSLTAGEWPLSLRRTRGEAIRAKCLDCSLNSAEVRKCVVVTCALWPYRTGGPVTMVPESTARERRRVASKREGYVSAGEG